MRHRPLRPLPARPDARLPRRPGLHLGRGRPAGSRCGSSDGAAKPTLAVWKFSLLRRLPAEPARLSRTSCSRSPSASRSRTSSRRRARPSTARTTSRSSRARSRPRRTRSGSRRSAPRRTTLVTIGACATAGGIQALRNFADVDEFVAAVYASARVHLDARHLDADLRPRRGRLRAARLPDQQAPAARARLGAAPAAASRTSPSTRVCVECKRRGIPCVMVARGMPCLGPVTHAGCGAICPAYARGCFGCFGPTETPNLAVARTVVAARSASTSRASTRARDVQRGSRSGGSVSEPTRRTIQTDYLARVEGEGAMSVRLVRRQGRRGRAADLRAAALLRGAPARALVPRGARHHGAHLRHLPGRVPDERRQRDGGRLRRRGRPSRSALLRRLLYCGEWIESHALHVYMLHAPDFLGYDGAVEMAREHPAVVERGLALKKTGNELMTLDRRPRDPSDERAASAASTARRPGGSCRRSSSRSSVPARRPLETVRWTAGFDFPERAVDCELVALAAPDAYAIERRPDRLRPRARHRVQRVRRALLRGARRALERAPFRRADGQHVPLRPARPLRAERRPALAARARGGCARRASRLRAATPSAASSSAASSSSTRATRRCG